MTEDVFDTLGTIGVEEEFYTVDAETHRPTAGIDELVYGDAPPDTLEGHLDHELFKCVIETTTPIATSVEEAHQYVDDARQALSSFARQHGYKIAGAGLHPAADWRALERTDKKRYKKQFDRVQLPQRRNLTTGVHIHVGIDDADKAIWIANELRWFCPLFLGVSANSPFWEQEDTGLSSMRASMLGTLPNTGIPDAYDSFDAFRQHEQSLLANDFMGDRGGIWWDVRPHTGIGTVEVRAVDGQHDVSRVKWFISSIHAAVMQLAEAYDRGIEQTSHRHDALTTNRWQALRYGMDAPVFERVDETAAPIVETLNEYCTDWGVEPVDWKSGAAKQREWYEEGGLQRMCDELIINWD